MIELGLKFDLRAPEFGTSAVELYDAALAMCSWADENGFSSVRFMEHHGSDDGYCPSPLVIAAAAAARTRRIRVRVQALVLPLHDPVRVAEDSAVIDLISRGRFELVIGAGYVPSEFAMFDRRLGDRPQLVERGIETLRRAWTGEPFEHDGRPALVALRPHREGGPPILLGGWSKASARRAARLGDGYEPTDRALIELYRQACRELGKEPGRVTPRMLRGSFLHVTGDVEEAWRRLGPHLLHEMNAYGRWLAEAGVQGGFRPVAGLDELRESGAYRIYAPDEFTALALELGHDPEPARIEFHPLVGGADPSIGWDCLHTIAENVLPILRDERVVAHQGEPEQ